MCCVFFFGGVLFLYRIKCYVHENWEMFFFSPCWLEYMLKNNIVNSISLVSCVVSTVMHTSVHCVYCFAKSVSRHCVYSCANPSDVLQIHCVLHPYYSMHLEAELAESV